MKSFLTMCSVLVLGSVAAMMAQNPPPANTQPLGQGRGGAPYAWNDKDKDGICDLTGAPVGQGRGFCGCRYGRWGYGPGARAGAGWGRGMGWRFGFQQQPQAPPVPQPAPEKK